MSIDDAVPWILMVVIILGAIGFGMWQHDVGAGLFGFAALTVAIRLT